MSRTLRNHESLDVGTLVECRPGDVDPSDRVWDIDQLPPDARRTFLAAVDGGARVTEADALAVGDVVRFTDYYRIR